MQDPNFLHEITTSVDLHRNFNPSCITNPGESCLPESPLSHIKGDAANPLRAFCAPEYSESCVSLADFIRNAAATRDPTGTGGVGGFCGIFRHYYHKPTCYSTPQTLSRFKRRLQVVYLLL